ncbi:Phakinin 49 kDa cytoskeletal protein [Triplophysa tibetana]|uniref:Phakinin 49 kDa cytoskeletal protein n=1 Tax=Triplophysa tibetana TaxID=1572043 RepID=A0A5A9PBG4_9TELE|nr:Phakinin 49 kDa cytoskeletal protein [Triplophysa tibetana]
MPMPRRRSSFLGQGANEWPGGMGHTSRVGTSVPRGVFVGMAATGGPSNLGARSSRRALGISSVFLQGLRTSVPVVTQHGDRGHQLGFDSLNTCLLEYRDKVHALEELNQKLEEQIRHCLDCKASGAGTWGGLKQDWEDVYIQVSDTILDNARLMLQTENVQANAEDFKERYENEQPFRKAVEDEINSLYKVIDDANFTRADLENQIESRKNELMDLEHSHTENVRVLYKQLAGHEVDEPLGPIETSLDQILAFIRSHWEKVIEKNRAESDAYLECKKAGSVTSKRSREEEELEGLKTECNEAGCKIQSQQAEIESMRALKRGLENALNDAKHWHDIELQNLGSVIGNLQAELADVRGDIEQQRQDNETLLNNKMKLELEIGTYHGILDVEERRFGSSACPDGSSVPEEQTAPTTFPCGAQSGPQATAGCNAPGASEENKNE